MQVSDSTVAYTARVMQSKAEVWSAAKLAASKLARDKAAAKQEAAEAVRRAERAAAKKLRKQASLRPAASPSTPRL